MRCDEVISKLGEAMSERDTARVSVADFEVLTNSLQSEITRYQVKCKELERLASSYSEASRNIVEDANSKV